jgi:hypothetical protein
MLPPLVVRSGVLSMESRAASLQSGTTPDSESTCEEVRSKMESEAKNLSANVPTNIKDAPRTHAQLGWSEFATVVAPDRAWQVEVHPVFTSRENHTPVTLRGCEKGGSWPLFILERDAEMYWGPDSSSLLVVNEPLSGTNQLLFFDVETPSDGKQTQAPDELDKAVEQVLIKRLGKNRRTEFYLPNLVSWKGSQLLLAVGGTSSYAKGESGPMKEYCYGFMINTDTLRVQEVLSATELKANSGAECETYP